MDIEFITYQKFNDVALANELAELLAANNIDYRVEEDSLTFNPSFNLNDEFSKEYAVKIAPADFEQVNDLLKQDAEENIGEVEADYYLLNFTDAELKEVITKADEWSAFDVQLARKLLAERGIALTNEEIKEVEEKRVTQLKEPEPSQRYWIIIGYVISIACLAMPFFISAIGLFIGWHLSSHQKTLPNGERIYAYSDVDRKHGQRIFYISIAVFLITLMFFIYQAFFRRPYYEN